MSFICVRKISCGGYARARFGVVEFSQGLDIPTPRLAATLACRKADGSSDSSLGATNENNSPRSALRKTNSPSRQPLHGIDQQLHRYAHPVRRHPRATRRPCGRRKLQTPRSYPGA
ncbi:hypothetical protein EMIT0P218_40189 [Pseudomonas sp. IT-P218]